MGSSNSEVHLGLGGGRGNPATSSADFSTAGPKTATPSSISEATGLHSSELNLFPVCNWTTVEDL